MVRAHAKWHTPHTTAHGSTPHGTSSHRTPTHGTTAHHWSTLHKTTHVSSHIHAVSTHIHAVSSYASVILVVTTSSLRLVFMFLAKSFFLGILIVLCDYLCSFFTLQFGKDDFLER